MNNTTDNLLKIAELESDDENKLIEELAKLADLLENNGLYEESQKTDIVVSFLQNKNIMEKEAGMRGVVNDALDFVERLFRSNNPRVRDKLEQVIQKSRTQQAPIRPNNLGDPRIGSENLNVKRIEPAKDYTSDVVPGYIPAQLPKADLSGIPVIKLSPK